MPMILSGDRRTDVPEAIPLDQDLWVPIADLEQSSGWVLKPEGACLGEFCVPLPAARETEFLRGESFNLASFWRHLGRPVVHGDDGQTWLLGESDEALRSRLTSLQAPEFTLPDLEGRRHSLSDYRGTKVFLVAWASW